MRGGCFFNVYFWVGNKKGAQVTLNPKCEFHLQGGPDTPGCTLNWPHYWHQVHCLAPLAFIPVHSFFPTLALSLLFTNPICEYTLAQSEAIRVTTENTVVLLNHYVTSSGASCSKLRQKGCFPDASNPITVLNCLSLALLYKNWCWSLCSARGETWRDVESKDHWPVWSRYYISSWNR